MNVTCKQTIPLLTRVVVTAGACVGCRPAIRPEGTIVEVGEEGVFGVLFVEGPGRWYRAAVPSLSRPRCPALRPP